MSCPHLGALNANALTVGGYSAWLVPVMSGIALRLGNLLSAHDLAN
jgi:hypothetical protein